MNVVPSDVLRQEPLYYAGDVPMPVALSQMIAIDREVVLLRNGDKPFVGIIFLNFHAEGSLRRALFEQGGLAQACAKGTILVDIADRTAEAFRPLAAEAARAGLHLIDAPLSGYLGLEGKIGPIVLYGAEEATALRIAPVLSQIWGEALHCGAAGAGHGANLFTAALGLSSYIATLEVATVGRKFGLPLEVIGAVNNKGSGRNRISELVFPAIEEGRAFGSMTLGRALRLLQLASGAAMDSATPLYGTGLALALYQTAVTRYGAQAPIERIVDMVESMAQVRLAGADPLVRPMPARDCALRVGYLGVGTMGGALARRLSLSRGVMVYDLNPAIRDSLAAEGFTVAPSPAALARECDVIFTCLPTSAILDQAIFGAQGLAEGLRKGQILIDQTTGNPAQTHDIAARLARLGVSMIDAPVSGGTRGAVAGTIAIIAGGPREIFEKIQPILAQISPKIIYCGAIGNGHAAKLLQNAIANCNRTLVVETAAAACRSGLRLEALTEAMARGSAWSGGAERILPNLAAGKATTDFAIGLMVKDLRLASELANEVGAPMILLNTLRQLGQICVNEEGAKQNLDHLSAVIARMSGTDFTAHA